MQPAVVEELPVADAGLSDEVVVPVAAAPMPLSIPAAIVEPAPPRERSALGSLTVGVMLIALGLAAMIDVTNVAHVTLVQYLALELAVLGCGMVVGAWYGRVRGLVVLSVMLLPFVVAASLIRVPFGGQATTGNVAFRPAAVSDVRPIYRLTAGQLVLDLRGLAASTAPITIRATDVLGRIHVRVGENTPVDVRAHVGAGAIQLFGEAYGGVNVDLHRQFGTDPVLHLDLETSFGEVEVTQ